jgi:hypothetical protein
MKRVLKKMALSLILCAGGIAGAQAATLTIDGASFTPSWSGNVLTLEIDADPTHLTGGYDTKKAPAVSIGAIALKDIGSFSSVAMTGPGGFTGWSFSSNELNANGCAGGHGGSDSGKALCFSGPGISLADNMIFKFTFTPTGTGLNLTDPHLKVNFLDSKGSQVGSLISENIAAAQVSPVPEPETYAMLVAGLGCVGVMARRRQSARA